MRLQLTTSRHWWRVGYTRIASGAARGRMLRLFALRVIFWED